ncbi:MAG: hypothetical protein ACLTMR_14350, partial [Faecalibacillus sp.]
MKTSQPASRWKTVYNQKIKKGYVDQTHLYNDEKVEDDTYVPIDNEQIREIVRRLQEYAITTIRNNFDVNIDAVADEMILEATKIIY